VPDWLARKFEESKGMYSAPPPRASAMVPPVESHVCPQCHGPARVVGVSRTFTGRVVVDHTDWCPFASLSHRMRMLTRHVDHDRR
jgi:hypothetical protein